MTTSTGARQAMPADLRQDTAGGLRRDSAATLRDNTAADRENMAAGCGDRVEPGSPFFFVQAALDGLDRPLAQTEFVVIDLETTGGSPANAAITELAAVRTRPGIGQPEVAAQEFATLVNPGHAIPAHVAMLTGITDALVAAAPLIEDVLPRFTEFAAGAVLVAHNAPFDIGFLAAACSAHNLPWPRLPVLDTAALARQLLTTDEVQDCRLGTLAGFFGAATRPNHRALDDARATTAVLHGLVARLAERGVHTLEALRGFADPPASQRGRMRQLTAGVPRQPGVCLFTAADGQVLHIMRSSDMHARACGYFAAAETRRQVREMVDKTARIVPLSCQTGLDAEIAEIRLIAMHRPAYRTDRRVPEPAARAAQTADNGHDGDTGSAAARTVAISALAAARLLVAARPRFRGGWDVAWISYGRLKGTAVLRPTAGPSARGAESCLCLASPCGVAASHDAWHEEAACLADWLASPGVRLIETEGTWCSPVADPPLQMHGAGQSGPG